MASLARARGRSSVTDRIRRLRPDVVAGMALFVACVLSRLPTLSQPLLESHGFRQTQTAYTALLFYSNGIDLLHPSLPVLGPPWEVPFEFPLLQAIASIVMHLGIASDMAMRLTAFAGFLATGGILWALVAKIGGRLAGVVALGCFLFSPFAMLWGRAALIESLATAAALGFVCFALDWRARERRSTYVAAIALGSLVMLVKATIGIWLLPFLLLGPTWGRFGIRGGHWKSAVAAWGLVLVPAAVGLAWTHYADSVKAMTAATQWLTSGALATWNFGSLDRRLQVSEWARIGTVIGTDVGGLGPIVLLLIAVPLASIFAWRRGAGRPVAWLLLSLLGGPLIFFNLYWVHDYYSAEIAPAVAGILGLAVAALLSFRVRRVVSAALGLGLLGLWLAALIGQANYWSIAYLSVYDPEHVLPAARQIAAETRPDELVAIVGRDWSPAVLYYARRRGYMVPGRIAAKDVVGLLAAQGYAVYSCPIAATGPSCVRLR